MTASAGVQTQVAGQFGEEPGRQRHVALGTTFAVGGEHPRKPGWTSVESRPSISLRRSPPNSIARAIRVRRLFVVDGARRFVGVVVRRDLLRGFLRTDGEIRVEIEREMIGRVLRRV